MCMKCTSATQDLEKALDELLVKHPATEVEGRKVDPQHHIQVALMNVAQKRLQPAAKMILAGEFTAELMTAAAGMTETRSPLFGGPKKDIAA